MSRRAAAALILLGAVLLPAPGRAQLRLLAFGDSITQGVGDDPARPELGYPPRLEALLEAAGIAAVVENHGVGGENTLEGLERINSVLARGGDALLLMEGTNDISNQISVSTTRFNLREMAQRAQQRGILTVHATVIPRVPWAHVDPDNKTNARLNQAIRDLADVQGRRLVDNFEVFGALPDVFAEHYVQAEEDHVGHPDSSGYDIMARTFSDVVRAIDTVPPVLADLFPADGTSGVPPTASVQLDVVDFGAGIDLSSAALIINGTPVTAAPQGTSRRATITHTPAQPWQGVVRVGLRARDLANPPNAVDRQVGSFVVAGTVFLQGDLDESGRVDGADLVTFSLSFGATNGELRYRRASDFDQNGIIDGGDLAVLASNFGRSSV